MKIAHYFIERPIFATVVSFFTVIAGMLAYFNLPVTEYPEIAPPTIQVTAVYPGASAEVVAKTIATRLEQQINGVEGMQYMHSQSTGDGRLQINITFELGTDLDKAQVQVQNRVAIAASALPDEVRRIGITTTKSSPDLLIVINLYSPDGTYSQNYITNYSALNIQDKIARLEGVGDVFSFGAAPYSMRIWLNPEKLEIYNLTARDVVNALAQNNVQVASGVLNQQPSSNGLPLQIGLQTKGRLENIEQFEDIVVKVGENGRTVRLKDIARVELGAESYDTNGFLATNPAIAIPVFQQPGSNAIATANSVVEVVKEAAKSFPNGLEYKIIYNPTEFVKESIDAVKHTIYEAIFLVVLVIVLFLQSFRAAIVPVLAIPVSLIGTFAVMQFIGFSLNYLTLFGLVLAIGIVVDDAIVVIENIERNLKKGLSAKEAAHATMKEVSGALVAMGLVVVAVFLPTVFIGGITGQFYKQFGVVIAAATVISILVSLILSPSLSAVIMKKHTNNSNFDLPIFKLVFIAFNKVFNKTFDFYNKFIKTFINKIALGLVVYALLIAVIFWQFNSVRTGFIPEQDRGYLLAAIQLPAGSSLDRTDAITKEAVNTLMSIDGISNAVSFTGVFAATFTNASNSAIIFPVFEDFGKRRGYQAILQEARAKLSQIPGAIIAVFPPPPVQGVGNLGGFTMMVKDNAGFGFDKLNKAVWAVAMAANAGPETTGVYSFFDPNSPHVYLDVNREQAQRLGVSVDEISKNLEAYIGSSFVNEFNMFGRNYRVTVQADSPYRADTDDVLKIKVRNRDGNMVPIGSVATAREIGLPGRIARYNLFPAASINGDTSFGFSSLQALAKMEQLADKLLPDGMSYEWTGLALQQKQTGNAGIIAFALAVVFVFLLLAALYESFSLPFAIILIVPMCLLSSIVGVAITGMENSVLTQMGFVILIALASKNAILIVEFAKQIEDKEGKDCVSAAIEAAKLRFRPILMTSFAFILGVLPMAIATGPGAELRRALGVSVFSGMLGVTFFGLIFTPIFYVICRKIAKKK